MFPSRGSETLGPVKSLVPLILLKEEADEPPSDMSLETNDGCLVWRFSLRVENQSFEELGQQRPFTIHSLKSREVKIPVFIDRGSDEAFDSLSVTIKEGFSHLLREEKHP